MSDLDENKIETNLPADGENIEKNNQDINASSQNANANIQDVNTSSQNANANIQDVNASSQNANANIQNVSINNQYIYPNAQYTNPNGQFVNANGQYINSQGQYMNPNGQYVYPNAQYINPNGQYVNAQGQYMNPNGQYIYPNNQFVNGQYIYPNGSAYNQNYNQYGYNNQYAYNNQYGYANGQIYAKPRRVKPPRIPITGDTLTEAKRSYSRIGFGIGGFYLAWNVIVILMTLLLFKVMEVEYSYTIAILLSLGFEILSIGIYWLVIMGMPTTKIEKRKLPFGTFMKCVMVMYFLSIGGSIAGRIVNGILQLFHASSSESNIATYTSNNYWLMVLYAAILAPIIEELVFRKLLIDRIRRFGARASIITSGIIFGLIHGNFEQFFYAFLIGLLFAFVYVKTGNIKYTIAMHMIMNGVSMILMYVMTKVEAFNLVLSGNVYEVEAGVRNMLNDPWQILCFIIVILITCLEYGFAIAGLIIFIIRFRKMRLPEDDKPQMFIKPTIFNPGMIFMYVVVIGFFIYGIF